MLPDRQTTSTDTTRPGKLQVISANKIDDVMNMEYKFICSC